LLSPNPNGRPNADVLFPWRNGLDIARRADDHWIIDFSSVSDTEAALYELPYAHVLANVKPERDLVARERRRRIWWQYNETAPGMRKAIAPLPRFIVTPEVTKHRIFAWLLPPTIPDKNLVVFAQADDQAFGILHSRFHAAWALRLGTTLEDRPRYTSTTTFETFPFPDGLTPDLPPAAYTNPHAEAIAAAAAKLNELREAWLNPPEWIDRVPEVVAGYPDRIIPKPAHAAELAKRTLTNLYNAIPTWLVNAHRDLDAAVALAYGWGDYTPATAEDEILRRLLALNLDRAKAS
jgi:type II restriction/modification system DNA methylase subunit YeeA